MPDPPPPPPPSPPSPRPAPARPAEDPVLPRSADELALGWGEQPESEREEDWYRRERPPHHGD